MAEPDLTDFPEYMRTPTDRFAENIARVESLINLHKFLVKLLNNSPRKATATEEELPPPDAVDVLRSAVILLHATLEDFLRSLLIANVPRTNNEIFRKISLAGTSRGSTSFKIKDLVQHKGKTIDEVLDESIEESLYQQSFSGAGQVKDALKGLGMPIDKIDVDFAEMEKMIQRRHDIVHIADHRRDGSNDLQPLTPSEVTEWSNVVERLVRQVLYQLQFVERHNP